MNGEAERRERIKAALTRFEVSGKMKRGQRKSVKLFSLDRDERYETGKEKET